MNTSPPGRSETILAILLFVAALAFQGWGASVGWESKNLPGVEYRQAQTALSAYWIKQGNDFSLAYPTPVLGKPWSVPMEFPLYQWCVVLTGRFTGLGLTKAGRVVSLACLYLSLPALFMLLGEWGVAPGRRWLVLALMVSCPLYIFYGRAFLIETMALMFSLWFAVAGLRAPGRPGWLVVAMLAGAGAGLVKVTTFILYLLPVGAWGVWQLWRARQDGQWRRVLAWLAPACGFPLLAAAWWVRKADAVKTLNPAADFLGSAHMADFNLGNAELRLSPELWAMKWRIISGELTWLPLLGLCGPLLLLGGRHRAPLALGGVLFFAAATGLFPVLYAYHDYYYVANTVGLLLAAGLVLVGLAEEKRWRWLALGAAAVLVAGQGWWYGQHYYPLQQGVSPGGNALTRALRAFTRPEEVVVIAGQDWNSMTPYYSQRRALMLRGDVDADPARIDQALARLGGERIGALVLATVNWPEKTILRDRLGARGLAEQPLLIGEGSVVFFPRDREAELVAAMHAGGGEGMSWAPGAEPVSPPLAGHWHQLIDLPVHQRAMFSQMQPTPKRFYASFEPQRQMTGSVPMFNAHPQTRLVFSLPAGAHRLRTHVWFNPDAYRPPSGTDATDGVELRLTELDDRGGVRLLASRLVAPAANPADRGQVTVEFLFELARAGEVELFLGPGAAGRDTRDWVWIRGPLLIE